jgi:hypothetical protein
MRDSWPAPSSKPHGGHTRPRDRQPSLKRKNPLAQQTTGPHRAEHADWLDFQTGKPLPPPRTTTGEPGERAIAGNRPLYLRTLRSILTAHIRAPERKSVDTAGKPRNSRTEGRLRPSPTIAHTTVPIGRETNFSDETGLIRDPAYTTYPDPTHDRRHEHVLTILRNRARLPGGTAELQTALGLSERGLRRYLNSGRARAQTWAPAEAHALMLARQILEDTIAGHSTTSAAAILHLGATRRNRTPPRCRNCGRELTGRQRSWCADCRASAWRRR